MPRDAERSPDGYAVGIPAASLMLLPFARLFQSSRFIALPWIGHRDVLHFVIFVLLLRDPTS